MNKSILVLLLTFAGGLPCLADTGLSEAAQHEINRRGAAVERVGDGHEASDSAMLLDALKPPADDSQKWYITLITAPNCGPCKKLHHDFANSPALRPWANPANHRDSFTHYDVFQVTDATQGWRFKELKGNQFPVVVIQPPKNGRWGDPTKCLEPIVGYDGDPRAMAAAIKHRIKDYVERYREAATSYRGKRSNREPVFELPPDEDVFPQESEGDDFFSQQLAPEKIMQTVAGIAVLGALALLFVREFRRQTGQPVYVNDQTAGEVEKVARVDHATVAAIVAAVLAALNQAKKES